MENLLIFTYKHIKEQIKIVQKVATCVIYQGFDHRLVAEKLAGKVFLDFKSHNTGLELCHFSFVTWIIKD